MERTLSVNYSVPRQNNGRKSKEIPLIHLVEMCIRNVHAIITTYIFNNRTIFLYLGPCF